MERIQAKQVLKEGATLSIDNFNRKLEKRTADWNEKRNK